VRETDLVARVGADVFALLLPLAQLDHASVVASKIIKALEPPIVIDDIPLALEASIGIALYPEHATEPDALLQRADVAMHAAKDRGASVVVYDAKTDPNSPRRLALMGGLRRAIDNAELRLHYQPKVSLKTGRTIGVEALVRWQHPQYGFVPPGEFIGPAERTGLIRPLTLWVIDEAMRQARAWREKGLPLVIAVNLSARNLHDPELLQQLSGRIRSDGLEPSQFQMEITESAIMLDPERALQNVRLLKSLGFGFSIDDFGTGYSSLSYLSRLPVSEIKIDRSFVIGMGNNRDDAVIVRSTIELAHNLGLAVVAEGVENKQLWDELADLGCDAAQGYYMSRPLPVEELTAWLATSARAHPLN
jgi:EAL domain-containing protein (putative c-di-GMP-specific phosphodiesterase class I)